MSLRRLPKHRAQRMYENQQKGIVQGVGEYGIPQIMPEYDVDGVEQWLSFNSCVQTEVPEKRGVHFFIDDYQFDRVWQKPERYIETLARFGAVMSPDFSPYSDFPKAIQIYNHYRKHWCGWYWQRHGIKVIPTITWSSPETLEWAFDGEPVGGVVAISSVGMFDTQEHIDWLIDGYEEMCRRLEPCLVLWKGKVPEELNGDDRIQKITGQLERLHGLKGEKD